jgi:hypothetical protein
MQQLAKLIESRMRGLWQHAAVHESDLQCICPLNDQDRERKIAEFATHYGFRLRFYSKGMCAIFDKATGEAPDGQTAAVGFTASIVAEIR